MVEIRGDSPQAVAYKLFELIAASEQKKLGDHNASPDRDWILATYKECLHAVLDVHKWGSYSG